LHNPIDKLLEKMPSGSVDKVVCAMPQFIDEHKSMFNQFSRLNVLSIELIGQRSDLDLTSEQATLPDTLKELRVRNIDKGAICLLKCLPIGI